MPILAKKNEYVIPITTKCNWKCPYCAINNKYDLNIKTDKTTIFKKIESLPVKCICTITGGEPGLVDYGLINLYINKIKEKNINLYLETNGLFIKKYPELIKKFDQILYHCSQDLDDKLDYIKNETNIRYIIVLTDSNLKKLDSYLELNFKGIKFDFIPASYPFNDCINGPSLSEKNKIHILTHYYKYMSLESMQRFFKDKDFNSIKWLF